MRRRTESVKYAINSMEMEGFKYTPAEKMMWKKIADGKLPLSAAYDDAQAFDKAMRDKYPDKYGGDDE